MCISIHDFTVQVLSGVIYVYLLFLSKLYNVKPHHCFAVKRHFDGRKFLEIEIYLNIVLVGENIRYIIDMPKPTPTNNNVTPHVKEEYDQWVASNNKVIDYIFATISDILRAKFEAKETTIEILDSLQEISEQKKQAGLYRDYRQVHYY